MFELTKPWRYKNITASTIHHIVKVAMKFEEWNLHLSFQFNESKNIQNIQFSNSMEAKNNQNN